MRSGKIWIDRNGASEQVARFNAAGPGGMPPVLARTQEEVIGLFVDSVLSGQPVLLFRRQLDPQRRNDLLREFVLV